MCTDGLARPRVKAGVLLMFRSDGTVGECIVTPEEVRYRIGIWQIYLA